MRSVEKFYLRDAFMFKHSVRASSLAADSPQLNFIIGWVESIRLSPSKGERTEVRGHDTHSFKHDNPHPALSLAKGEAKSEGQAQSSSCSEELQNRIANVVHIFHR
jgi:hypothetical protein